MFTYVDGALWYDFMPVISDSKGLADGSGWIAHVTEDRLAFLLAYPDIQPSEAAPGEAEVELFTGAASGYVEMETQGALTSLAPGGTLVWTVRWKLRQLPSGTSVSAGSSALASFASPSSPNEMFCYCAGEAYESSPAAGLSLFEMDVLWYEK